MSVFLFVLFFLLTGPFGYFGIDDRLVTFGAYLILIVGIFVVFNIPIFFSLSNIRAIFFVYITVLFLINVLLSNKFLQGFVAYAKFFLLVLLLQITFSKKISTLKDEFIKMYNFLLIWLLSVSTIQYFRIEPFAEFFLHYGNNQEIGKLFLDIFFLRVNGGIGGTVIDFSVLIILLNYLNFFVAKNTKDFVKNLFILILLSFYSFSRITILSYFFVILALFVSNIKNLMNNYLKILLIIFSIFSILILTILHSNELKIIADNIFAKDTRILMWAEVADLTSNYPLFGNDFGRNLGLSNNKVVTDGLFFAILSETGIIGLILYFLLILEPILILRKKMSKNKYFIIVIAFVNICFINIVNSGFIYHLNILFYSILLITAQVNSEKI